MTRLSLIILMLTFFTSNALKAPEGRQSLSTVAGSKHATELKNETSPASRELRLDFVTETVRKVGPAVVRIIAETKPSKGIEGPSDEVRQNFGSGFIFSEDGLILTKAHGMEEADKITVSLPDGREYEAIVKGIDPIVDIAVLKIVSANESNEFPVAKLVDSDVLNVGQIVVAIGNPAEFDNTVTMGIVSGLGRSSTTISGPHIKVDYIQTDVAMNSGSSGGPLIDVETGDVVGINAGSVDSMAGTTFSIPINRIRHIIDSLSQGREVQHGYLGLSVMKCTPAWARQINAKLIDSSSYRAPEIHGVFVQTVHPFTPAEKGELRLGDVIIEVGGKAYKSLTIYAVSSTVQLLERYDLACKMFRAFTRVYSSLVFNGALTLQPLVLTVVRENHQVEIIVEPMDLATRLKEAREQQDRKIEEILNLQDVGQF